MPLDSNAQMPQKPMMAKRRAYSILIETNPCHAPGIQSETSIVLLQGEEQIHTWLSKGATRSINQCELGLCSCSIQEWLAGSSYCLWKPALCATY